MNTLSDIQEKDKVIRANYVTGMESIETVSRVTKTLIITKSHERFKKSDGHLTGKSVGFMKPYIKAASEEDLKRVNLKITKRWLANYLQHYDWWKEELLTLKMVKGLLKPEAKNG